MYVVIRIKCYVVCEKHEDERANCVCPTLRPANHVRCHVPPYDTTACLGYPKPFLRDGCCDDQVEVPDMEILEGLIRGLVTQVAHDVKERAAPRVARFTKKPP